MPKPAEKMTHAEWNALGEKLYGEDRTKWEFRCVNCGHVQSHAAVKARDLTIGDTSNWIYFSCEGRMHKGHGCDWTLGGLFRIHKRVVVHDDGEESPVFLFAAEESMDALIKERTKGKFTLTPGRFYRSYAHEVWCCFQVNLRAETHAQAWCICFDRPQSAAEYFFLDGRYDIAGKREHTLIEELPLGWGCPENEVEDDGSTPSDDDIWLLCSKLMTIISENKQNGGPMLHAAKTQLARQLREAISLKLGEE